MDMQPVTSSNLQAIGYDESYGVLAIEFRAGTLYLFGAVPRRIFDELRLAPSLGRFFLQHIRGRYVSRRIR